MTVPDDVTHVVVSGTAASGEDFAFGFWVLDADASFGAGLDAITTWVTFRTALLSHMVADCAITQYDTYHYSGGAVDAHDMDSVNHVGTDSSGYLPLQVACVLTLRSATLTRSGRGRLYLPTTGFSMMAAGHLFASSAVNALVDDFVDFGSDLLSLDHELQVVSRLGDGAARSVISVDADYVPDTQRRRRNKLTSARHSGIIS